MNYLDAIYYSLKPKNFIGITSPEFLKLTVFTGEKYLWVDSFWVGILPFLVGIFGLLSIKRKKIFYGFILIFIILSFGEYTEIYKYFYTYLPFLKITRHPSQFIYPIVIILVIVSSKGFDMILKRNKKKCFVIIFLSLIELLYYSYGVHPTAENVFFKEKGPVVKYFKELSKGEYFRFILTPKTDAERKIPYRDRIEQGWFIAKDKLYNLTSLPHHIFDAGGIGEPLEIREHRKIIESVGLQFDPDTANQFLNLINVKYLLSNYRINSKIYELIKETHIFIYKNKKYLPRVYYYSQKGNPQIANYKNNLVDIRLSDNQKQNEDKIILLDTYYPGWKVFIDGKRGNILKENDLFRMVNVKKNDKLVRFIYLPYTFLIGLIGSLISFLGILVYVKKTG